VLPVVLVAMLLERESELALYEEGTFVPGLTAAVTERLLRSPQKFELQRTTISGGRAAVVQRLAGSQAFQGSTLVPVVRDLVRLATALPDYARNTARVSATAVAVREALLRAKEPSPLLFTQLPQACGMPPIASEESEGESAAPEFVQRLKLALRELRAAYPDLLKHVVKVVGESLGLPTSRSELREALAPRAARLVASHGEPLLKSFLIRAADTELDDEAWVVSLATLLAGKPPASWNDGDVETATMKMGALRRGFRTLESLHLAALQTPIADDGYLLRVSVAQPGRPEAERVVAVRAAEVSATARMAAELARVVRAHGTNLSRDARAAALALCARDLLAEDEEPNVVVPSLPEA
jgi:hypothetical protein